MAEVDGRRLTLCPYCYCTTWSIPTGDKYICGKCGRDKSKSDLHWIELQQAREQGNKGDE